nr:PREDICTED: uncharacterized protein LOC107398797 [Tribolium castaneum]|eukprot:XP_015839703.1 PREDICTED: uncharacterized protein LOC107398797 [Tribolium castaneum]
MLFLDCYAGEAGSVHDATVFRRSDIMRRIPNINFPNESHLFGDAAYPLLPHLMFPYKNNGHLTDRQINYNTKLSKTRVVVEKAYALLKGRFRRLKLVESQVPEATSYPSQQQFPLLRSASLVQIFWVSDVTDPRINEITTLEYGKMLTFGLS